MASAEFTINTAPNPAAHVAAYGSLVTLALSATADVSSVTFSITGASNSAQAFPTISSGGIPLGATSTFTMPADPDDGLGRSFRVRCRVTSVSGDVLETHGIVGAVNGYGMVPVAAGEGLDRDASAGWIDVLNRALSGTVGVTLPNFQTGTSYTVTASDLGRMIYLNNAAAITLTVPEDATENLPAGFTCGIVGTGAGQVEVVTEGTDTLEPADSYTKLRVKRSAGCLIKEASGVWGLYGDLSA